MPSFVGGRGAAGIAEGQEIQVRSPFWLPEKTAANMTRSGSLSLHGINDLGKAIPGPTLNALPNNK